eukprot:COSAG01_NODE_39829_length_471_cov_1.653226_1_plen_32_part_01
MRAEVQVRMMRHHGWREATSQGEIHGALSGPL